MSGYPPSHADRFGPTPTQRLTWIMGIVSACLPQDRLALALAALPAGYAIVPVIPHEHEP